MIINSSTLLSYIHTINSFQEVPKLSVAHAKQEILALDVFALAIAVHVVGTELLNGDYIANEWHVEHGEPDHGHVAYLLGREAKRGRA
ncbi:hypothetical protein PI125_g8300 [Phytophthora idaei]|nr:hypothetical protein PI125_g8300 [Phytophthora idaei]